MYVLNECFQIIIPKKCVMKIKKEKKRHARNNYFDGWKEFVWVLHKKIERDLKDLRGNYS